MIVFITDQIQIMTVTQEVILYRSLIWPYLSQIKCVLILVGE
jgi:hypothetical protein